MAAPVGNQFWKARAKHGRDRIFSSPDAMWESALEYFQWVEDNPLYEEKAWCHQGEVTVHKAPKMRAMTLQGFCSFIDAHLDTFYEYEKREDFFEVCTKIKETMYQQKFTGAAAELLNPSIIARDLGLADKTEQDQKLSGALGIADLSGKTDEELHAIINGKA